MDLKIQLSYPEFFLLNKMVIQKFIGGKRTILTDVMKGGPPHEIKSIKNAFKTFQRKGYIRIYGRKKGDPYFSLIPSKVAEIIKILEYNCCPNCGKYWPNIGNCDLCNKNI